jgi:hypothetical protein
MASARTSGDESVTMGWSAGTFASFSIRPSARAAVRRVAMSGLRSPVSIGASADESPARASSASSRRWRTDRSDAIADGGPDWASAADVSSLHPRSPISAMRCVVIPIRRVDYNRNDTLLSSRAKRGIAIVPDRWPRFPVPGSRY